MSSAPRPDVVPERQRRHTLYFLEHAFARQRTVSIDTEVDMTAVVAHRRAARAEGRRYGLVSYVVWAGARAVAAHPEANSSLTGRFAPRLVRHPTATAKVALDRTRQGRRVVLSALVPEAEQASLDEIQDVIDRYRNADPERAPEFAGVRKINQLPAPVGSLLFRRLMSRPAARAAVLGTFSVSSLGSRPIDAFSGAGGTAVTLNVGQMRDRAWVRDGELAVAPVMRVNLTFDHRVVDGAPAADVLGDIKTTLEGFHADRTAPGAADDHSRAAADRLPQTLE
ncbi:2-oxo acid dehydrogenase subunit E2 [Streptomyces sp. NPDC056486]|uniref:2-oxo acid dehydrogenase subunit E2 n=1 Tax=Streptomyces sp. NPDC056486 TaxID=3345835 RepID=UPI0036761A6E